MVNETIITYAKLIKFVRHNEEIFYRDKFFHSLTPDNKWVSLCVMEDRKGIHIEYNLISGKITIEFHDEKDDETHVFTKDNNLNEIKELIFKKFPRLKLKAK